MAYSASDDFNRANTVDSLGSNWVQLPSGNHFPSIVSNTCHVTSGSFSTGIWGGGVDIELQDAESSLEFVGTTGGFAGFDMYFRADMTPASQAYFYAEFIRGTTSAVILDILGVFEHDFDLPVALADGDVIRVRVQGTAVKIYQNDVLATEATLPAIAPTDGGAVGGWGFAQFGAAVVDNWTLDELSSGGLVQLTEGNFQDCDGNPIADGTLVMQLSADQKDSAGGQICGSKTCRIALDANGAVDGSVSVWPNDPDAPNPFDVTTWIPDDVVDATFSHYVARVYSAVGQLVWGPHRVQIIG